MIESINNNLLNAKGFWQVYPQQYIQHVSNLNHSLNQVLQSTLSANTTRLIHADPSLTWLLEHPLQGFVIALIGIYLLLGIVQIIASLFTKIFIILFGYPFKLFKLVFQKIWQYIYPARLQVSNIAESKQIQQQISDILNQLETTRKEQNSLLQQLAVILKNEAELLKSARKSVK